MFEHATFPVLAALAAVLLILLAATAFVAAKGSSMPAEKRAELEARTRSWWVMIALFAAALVLSSTAFIVFFAFVSLLALKEYLSLIPTRRADRRVLFWAYLSIPVHYYWIASDWYGMFIIFIPVYMFLFLPFRMVLAGETKGFLRAAGTLHWGLMTTVFALSHIAALLVLPLASPTAAGGAGLVLFIVFLTEFNDVAQFTWGRAFGRHRIVPFVSPNKTWEGFIGGLFTTTVLAWPLAAWLTPLSTTEALAVGVGIAAVGFVGDVVMSAVKRDLGVKDSSQLIPGHGGVLDRVDSLLYTAPLFYHYVRYFHGA